MCTKQLKIGIVILILIISGIAAWMLSPTKEIYQPPRFFSNDTLFLAQTSDFLFTTDGRYLISESPILKLPNANKILSFKGEPKIMEIFSTIPQTQDKRFSITWMLSDNRLMVWEAQFIYPGNEMEKYYPDESYLMPIAKAAKKYWKQHAPDSIPAEVKSWKQGDPVYASWYSGTLYAKKVEHALADSVLVDGVYKYGFPVLKLQFKNGILEHQQELWQLPDRTMPPPPDSIPGFYETD